MVFANQYANDLVKKLSVVYLDKIFKKFSKNEILDFSVYRLLDMLSDFIVFNLNSSGKKTSELEIKIYMYIESLLLKCMNFSENTDENEMCSAICTGFLENLIFLASSGNIKYERFIPYLGENSKEYCKYIDQFTGVRSPGLWGDLEWHRAPKGPQSMIEENNKLDN